MHPEIRGRAEFGMDINTVSESTCRATEDSKAAEEELKELVAIDCGGVKNETREHEAEIIATVRALGESVHQYRRERRKAVKAIVCVIYSPPRVAVAAKLLPELKVIPRFSLNRSGRPRRTLAGLRSQGHERPGTQEGHGGGAHAPC